MLSRVVAAVHVLCTAQGAKLEVMLGSICNGVLHCSSCEWQLLHLVQIAKLDVVRLDDVDILHL